MGKTDLKNLLRPERNHKRANGGDNSMISGENNLDKHDSQGPESKGKLNEDILKDLCAISAQGGRA